MLRAARTVWRTASRRLSVALRRPLPLPIRSLGSSRVPLLAKISGAAVGVLVVGSAAVLSLDGLFPAAEASGTKKRGPLINRIWIPIWPEKEVEEDEDPREGGITVEEAVGRIERNKERRARRRLSMTDAERDMDERDFKPFAGYLPPLPLEQQKRFKYTVVLSLEGCIMDAYYGSLMDHMVDPFMSDKPSASQEGYSMRRRASPVYLEEEAYMFRRRRGLFNLILRMRDAGYEVVVYTGQGFKNLALLMDDIDPMDAIDWLIIGEQLSRTGGVLDLDKLNRDIGRVVVVDVPDRARFYKDRHMSNVVQVSQFRYTDQGDEDLLPVTVFLEMLAAMNVDDVRPYLERAQSRPDATWREVFGDDIFRRMPSSRVLDARGPAQRRAPDPAVAEERQRMRQELDQEIAHEFMGMRDRLTPQVRGDPWGDPHVNIRRMWAKAREAEKENPVTKDEEWHPLDAKPPRSDDERRLDLAYLREELAESERLAEQRRSGDRAPGLYFGGMRYAPLDALHLYEERILENQHRLDNRLHLPFGESIGSRYTTEAMARQMFREDLSQVAPEATTDMMTWMATDGMVHNDLLWRYDHLPDRKAQVANMQGSMLQPFKHNLRGVQPVVPGSHDLAGVVLGSPGTRETMEAWTKMQDEVGRFTEIADPDADHTTVAATNLHDVMGMKPLPKEINEGVAGTPVSAMISATPDDPQALRRAHHPVSLASPTLIGHRLWNAGSGQFRLENVVARASVQDADIFADTEAWRKSELELDKTVENAEVAVKGAYARARRPGIRTDDNGAPVPDSPQQE